MLISIFDVNVGVYSHFGVDRGVVAFGVRLDVLVDVVGGVGVVFENDVVDRGVHIDVDVDVGVVVDFEIHVSCWCQSLYSF